MGFFGSGFAKFVPFFFSFSFRFPYVKALTEPDYGSDASALKTTATKVEGLCLLIFPTSSFHIYFLLGEFQKVGLAKLLTITVQHSVSYSIFMLLPVELDEKVAGGWILDGQKRWIGNSTFADVLIIFARNTTTNQINGYVKDKYERRIFFCVWNSWLTRQLYMECYELSASTLICFKFLWTLYFSLVFLSLFFLKIYSQSRYFEYVKVS